MGKENYSQMELFSQVGRANGTVEPGNRSFLNYLRVYERVLIAAIGLIITGIVCFSLGVESGKRQAAGRQTASAEIPKALPSAPVKPAVVPLKSAPFKPAPPAAYKPSAGSYIIQLATFQSKPNALSEADALRKKGFYPFFFLKGSYVVLCVGNFANQEAAQSLLPEFKKQYKDCMIRRL
jgi:hypothetical protein